MHAVANPIRCVALDFDLTIFDYSRPQDTRVLIPWFQRLYDANVIAGIASGRTLEDLKRELSSIDMPWENPFPQFVIHEEFYIHWPDAPDPGQVERWNQACSVAVRDLCRKVRPYFDTCATQMESLGIRIEFPVTENDAGISLVLEDPAGAERARILLESMLPRNFPARISRNHHILLATPAEYHKGSALDRLRQLAAFDSEDVLAIGDNLNDLAMLDKSRGFRCATVENADPVVRKAVAERQGHQASRPIAFGIVELFDQIFGLSVAGKV